MHALKTFFWSYSAKNLIRCPHLFCSWRKNWERLRMVSSWSLDDQQKRKRRIKSICFIHLHIQFMSILEKWKPRSAYTSAASTAHLWQKKGVDIFLISPKTHMLCIHEKHHNDLFNKRLLAGWVVSASDFISHEIQGSNPTGGRIQLMNVRCFMALSFSFSLFYHLDMIFIMLEGM